MLPLRVTLYYEIKATIIMEKLPEYLGAPGHLMEIQGWYGMGGGIEELFLWCHTCDPGGHGIPGGKIDLHAAYSEGSNYRESMLKLRKVAFKHTKDTK